MRILMAHGHLSKRERNVGNKKCAGETQKKNTHILAIKIFAKYLRAKSELHRARFELSLVCIFTLYFIVPLTANKIVIRHIDAHRVSMEREI